MTIIDSKLSRRSLCVAGAAAAVFGPSVAKAQSKTVTMVSYGGSYQEAQTKHVFEPFTKETGITVNVVPPPGFDKIKAMQQTGNVTIDVYLLQGPEATTGSKQGFFEKLDHSRFDLKDLTIQPGEDYVTYETFPYVIAWNPKKFGEGKHPSTFADFFDLKKFPGRRAVRSIPTGTYEAALLADGVAPNSMYPLDLDRAFKVLDRIKQNAIFSSNNVQSVALVQTGEVDFSMTFSSRVKATNEPGGGVPLSCSFEQFVVNTDTLCVAKGAPNKENAFRLIEYHLRPEVQARFYNQLGLTPVSRKAMSMISPETRKWMPDFSKSHVVLNSQYWGENYDAGAARLKLWALS